MSPAVATAKCLGLYLIFLLPLARLRFHPFDPHIGNSTASRVSGLPLLRIFLQHSFGMPIPMLSLSLQYDLFGSNLKAYKLFHAWLISCSGPLFYLFAYLLTGREDMAFLAALFYAVSFHFPVTGNWLIQPEHYELLFFLGGASVALYGSQHGVMAALLAGAFLLGCSQLCKLPGLASIWIMTCLLGRSWQEGAATSSLVVAVYLAPYLLFLAGEKMAFSPPGVTAAGKRKPGGPALLISSTVSRYLSHYRSDPRRYLHVYVYYHLKGYLLQFLPLLLMAAVYFAAGVASQKNVMWVGLGIVSLIMVVRMGFAYLHSVNVVISLAAGCSFFALRSPELLPAVVASAVVSAIVSAVALRVPIAATFRRSCAEPTNLDMLASYIAENLPRDEHWFANINSSLAFLYTLSGRGFPGYFTILAMGGYGPRIDHRAVPEVIADEGLRLAEILLTSPPKYVVQSCGEWPIVNLAAVERYCGLTYSVCAFINPFVVYRLTQRREVAFHADRIEIPFLFDAEQGLQATRETAATFVDLMARMERIASLKNVRLRDGSEAPQQENEYMVEPSAPPQHSPDTEGVRCVFLDTYYPGFLDKAYQAAPSLQLAPYEEQKATLLSAFFGDSDYYSRGLRTAGCGAENRIVNCQQLQRSWAGEQGFNGSLLEIAVEQVRRSKPDVVYIQDLNICSKEFLDLIRPHTSLIVGQIASPLPASAELRGFDIIVSSFPHFVERFRQAGITSYYQPLAFDARVLQATPRYQYDLRPVDCAFVGGLSPMHGKGYGLMEYLTREVPIHFWGYGAETLPADSGILPRHHGEVWGRDMFMVLASSKISVNRHIDVAEENANNMRLFEATGCGALLITDYKENLDDLFEIGKEVVAYRTPEECAALIKYYLANPHEAAAIARAGQERTLREHSYILRMAQTAEILERHLRSRREAGSFHFPERVSDGHQAIAPTEVTPAMESAWKDPAIPIRQRALVQQELAAMYRGTPPPPFRVLAEVMKPITAGGSSVLEIGCASGYYYEVLEYLLNRRLDYTGVDYSEAMIAMAKEYYPKAKFFAADGASLFFADRSFDTVISSCVLLHVPNYREHIYESARVAKDFIIAARTPICRKRPTQYLKKFAYGVETVELVYNEDELLREFALNGFQLRSAVEYGSAPESDSYQLTYLLQRR